MALFERASWPARTPERNDGVTRMQCKQRLYLTKDSKRLVAQGDKAAHTLYAVPGDEIPQSAVDRFKLEDGYLKGHAPKEHKGGQDKEQKGGSDKEQKTGDDKSQGGAGQGAQAGTGA